MGGYGACERLGIMDKVEETRIWIPAVTTCLCERTGNYRLISYGTMEGSGMSYVIGNITTISGSDFARDAFRLVMRALDSYREWPEGTIFQSDIARMERRQLNRFVREHKFVDVLRRESSLLVCPRHRESNSWRRVKSFIQDEIAVQPNPRAFLTTLMTAFDLAT